MLPGIGVSMTRNMVVSLILGMLVFCSCPGLADDEPTATEQSRVEVNEIDIARRWVADASPDADIANMHIALLIKMPKTKAEGYLNNGQTLRPNSLGKPAAGDPTQVLRQGYQRFRPGKGTSLLLAVAEVGETESIDFDFADIKLP